jgi:peptidoglycan/LPS O-acetylase OafA/YrhL
LVYLGKISFGLYVFHALSLYFVEAVIAHASSVLFQLSRIALTFVITVFFAALSYRFLELPFLRFKQRFARARV